MTKRQSKSPAHFGVLGGKREGAEKTARLKKTARRKETQKSSPKEVQTASADATVNTDAGLAGATIHPFDTDPADHCETPREAYEHLRPFLQQLSKHLRKKPSELLIYDPYYCEGSMRVHLSNLGFTNVYNRNEDFYAAMEEGRVPDYDILVTSPPYSRDHMQRLAEFCGASSKPWALLLPSFVHRKQYWQERFPQGAGVVWVVPDQHYHYWSICGGRQHNMQVCRHWAREGRCTYGDACAFLHGSTASKAPMVKAPAKVEAGAAPNQNVSPHLLSPYFSLWHVHIPQKPWSLVCDKWSIKGANLAFTAEALAQLLPSKQKRKQQPPESGEEDKERQLSLEEALEAERERVRHKRQAFQEADARRQRAAAARQLEAAQ